MRPIQFDSLQEICDCICRGKKSIINAINKTYTQIIQFSQFSVRYDSNAAQFARFSSWIAGGYSKKHYLQVSYKVTKNFTAFIQIIYLKNFLILLLLQ